MAKLSDDLLQKIRHRAADPDRRTYVAGGDVPEPPGDQAWAEVERLIGGEVPQALKQIYSIGDGGFGPGGGLMPLAQVAADRAARSSRPFGPMAQPWPDRLLVLTDPNDTPLCLDVESGKIIAWEADRIEDEKSDSDWQSSFLEEAPSLASWFEEWLGTETHEELRARLAKDLETKIEARGNSPVTGLPIQYDDLAEQVEAEIDFLGRAPDLRTHCGLPESGWEEEVRRKYGFAKR